MGSGFWDKRVDNSTGYGLVAALIVGHTLFLPMSVSGRYLLVMYTIAGLFAMATVASYIVEKRRGVNPSKAGLRIVVYTTIVYALLMLGPMLQVFS